MFYKASHPNYFFHFCPRVETEQVGREVALSQQRWWEGLKIPQQTTGYFSSNPSLTIGVGLGK